MKEYRASVVFTKECFVEVKGKNKEHALEKVRKGQFSLGKSVPTKIRYITETP